MNSIDEYSFRIAIVGNSGVGKSNILHRVTEYEYVENDMDTIGVDFKIKKLNVNGYNIKLYIWDTSWKEKFRSLIKFYYREVSCVLIVFDISDINSINSIPMWENDVKLYSRNNCIVYYAENKVDKINTPPPFLHNIKYYTLSAKTGCGIEKLFKDITISLLKKVHNIHNIDWCDHEYRLSTISESPSEVSKDDNSEQCCKCM